VRRQGLKPWRADLAVRNSRCEKNRGLARPATGDPAEDAWAGIRAQTIRATLAELPEVQRHVLALAYFGGYTQREIAQLTGVPLGTVKTRTFAAMRRLLLRLSDAGGLAGEGSS
jgi:RNA polymerase sigma factor (sigma-70 family)